MYDSDLFGVQDPETGEVGYCCVLGALGELLGLNVYLGARGLAGYLGMRAEYPEADPDIIYKLDTLVVHFDDRSFMEPEDLKGITFSVRRSFRKGDGPFIRIRSFGSNKNPVRSWPANFSPTRGLKRPFKTIAWP
jgi:hypothetical protein